jgi:hypothetical protein
MPDGFDGKADESTHSDVLSVEKTHIVGVPEYEYNG